MRKIVSAGLIAAMILAATPAGAFAAGKTAAKRQDQSTGTIKGDTKNAQGEKLTQTKVRVRNAQSGTIAAELTTDAAGNFVGVVPAGSYTIEVLGPTGTVIGLSPIVSVAAGQTATISITASAVAAVGAASGAGAATAAGFGLFGLGAVATVAVLGGATAATVVGIQATRTRNRATASPSR